ncbi:MAG: cellulase family glycosylhydrolase [Bacteroidales bacterium]|nr:cellulase family glycosylhydrolase [Bacteroidales bacterium]
MKTLHFRIFFFAVSLLIFSACNTQSKKSEDGATEAATIWSTEKANEWAENLPWLRGANFNPSTAINQLETWQAESFDPETIDRELGWAADIGLNCMRVYLHHLAWQVDRDGFKERMGDYLTIADSHGIKTIFVFFDDCWNPEYEAGKQPEPKTGIHNSGWVRDPGDRIFREPDLMDTLEVYVKDVLNAFTDDQRIVLWDLYNEPGNNNLGNKSMPLLKNVFAWAREVNPSQPLSVGVWLKDLVDLNLYQLENSDVITYHNYSDEVDHKKAIDSLKLYNRPLVCTEYMARTRGSLFSNIMPLLKEENVGAINWGLVAGKSNTMYAWDTPMPDGAEPEVWFHDIFRPDGSVFDQDEIELIKSLTGNVE